MFKEVQQAHVQAAPNFGHNSRQPRSLVFDITEASARRLWDCSSASGEPMSSLAARWVGDSCKLDGPPSVCLALPIPHALLCCSSAWLSHAIPMPLGRTRQEKAIRRWVSAKRLFRLFQDVLADTSDDLDHLGPQWELSPDRLQRVADLMRLHILERRPLTEADRDDCSFHVNWLQNIVDSLIEAGVQYGYFGAVRVVLQARSVGWHACRLHPALLRILRKVHQRPPCCAIPIPPLCSQAYSSPWLVRAPPGLARRRVEV